MRVYQLEKLDGNNFRDAVASGVKCLEYHRDTINALNVFPVPDGDTGTNMLLTMRAGLEAWNTSTTTSLGDAAQSLSRGLFLGARGNSGVILSQFFKVFCDTLAGLKECTVTDLAAALCQGSAAAYQAVGQPFEGTMLSVIRAASEGAHQAQADGDLSMSAFWEVAYYSAKTALALTPSQLPVLAQAGVVDAGGMGVVAIIGGMRAYFNKEQIELTDLGIDPKILELATPSQSFIETSHHSQWGYCIQFLIEAKSLAIERVRTDFELVSESVVVIGDAQQVRVHVHAEDPGPSLSYGISLGQLSQIQIENMSQQNRRWHSDMEPPTAVEGPTMTVVAVTPGEGFHRLFRNYGCAEVIHGGQTMNPSVRQIIEAARSSGARDVIFLTNNPNIIAAAQQAANEGQQQFNLHVIPTLTPPQGVAAILAFNPEESLEHNLKAMGAVWKSLVTIEVTQAVRDTSIGGKPVAQGEYIALINGELVLSAGTAESATLQALKQVGLTADLVLTLYWGEGATEVAAKELAVEVEHKVPDIQVDVVYGGQPHYPYLVSVE